MCFRYVLYVISIYVASQTSMASLVQSVDREGFGDELSAIDNRSHFSLYNRTLQVVQFETIRINSGGPQVLDSNGETWSTDTSYAQGGRTFSRTIPIENTVDDILYETCRYGQFSYKIPVPDGMYEIVFYFAEFHATDYNARLFSIKVESALVFQDVDLISLGNGKKEIAVSLETVASVDDGFLNIDFVRNKDLPLVNAVEVKILRPHFAHAVTNGPYFAVDAANVGSALVKVDGSLSHTHGVGHFLESIVWKKGGVFLGSGDVTQFSLPVGENLVTLYVTDSEGYEDSESTLITVFPFGYPAITEINPTSSNVAGGSIVSITGTGFQTKDNSIAVSFGNVVVSGATNIRVVSDSKIEVTIPPSQVGAPVDLSVQNSLGSSNSVKFTYVLGTPIAFKSVKVNGISLSQPTVATFDSKRRLYVATSEGKIGRFSLTDDFSSVRSSVISSVLQGRAILGIAFDPMSLPDNPAIYVSHSTLFHGESKSTSGLSINGKVSRIEGANLDIVVDVITNLPVSDHDHAVNGLEFGDHGELYIQVGGNTNAGVPGGLSGSRLLKENPLSAATIVAYLSDPDFDGNLSYDADDDGNVVGGKGINVYASGQRNSFDITLHSNGNLYATDNGPNSGYGKRSTGCNVGNDAPDPEERDKLNLIVSGGYYGHANRKRGEKDAKQCVWQSPNSMTSSSYKAPMLILPASTNGIIEFQTNHFDGQLRHNLILS